MAKNTIEAIYPLTPLQQGMLFHTIYAPQEGTYVQQVVFTLHGDLSVAAFQQAWQFAVDRHAIFRTGFMWERRDKPLQVVQQQATLPWKLFDWRTDALAEQQSKVDALLQTDRRHGFDLTRPPLMRLFLIQITTDSYYFIWSRHHMVLDGWSSPLVFQDVFTAYDAFSHDTQPRLERCRPYADYIAWLQQQDQEKAEAYWRQTLKGFTTPTSLGVDRAAEKTPDQKSTFRTQQIQLSEATTSALQALAKRERVTLNVVVQAAYALLLSRYSGEQDVIFGTVVSGRPATLPGVEEMVGCFMNTLPVRVQVAAEETLGAWLKRLQEQQVELREYEYSSLAQVQTWSEIPRGRALFESLLIFENYPGGEPSDEQSRTFTMQFTHLSEQTNYPLTVMVVPASQLFLHIGYFSERFEDATIERMLTHLQTILAGMAGDVLPNTNATRSVSPHQPLRLADISLMAEDERQQVLVEWNTTSATYSSDICIHTLFEEQVERSPGAIAVVAGDEYLTYRELNRRSNALAHHLREMGVGPEALVCICMERSLELLIGLLATLKAGGAYVPLDPAYPPDRLAYMLQDTQAAQQGASQRPVLLTQQRLLAKLPELEKEGGVAINIVCLDAWIMPDWGEDTSHILNNPSSGVQPDNLAYTIYTSGTTGRPKGVQVSHRAIGNRLLWSQTAYPLTSEDRVLQVASFSFDIALWELLGPLTAGARVILARPGGQQDPTYLLSLMAEQRVTVAHFVPSLLQVLVEDPALARCTALRGVFCGGEQVPADLPERFFACLPADLHQFYGPTEAAINPTFWVCQRGTKQRLLPIGRPITNAQIYLLDAQLQPVPIGVEGEIYIGGLCLARAYLNQPELTAERFIPSPFVHFSEKETRLYKTGDMARYLPDGNLEYRGRRDDQVKIRGFRIELGEIEAILRKYTKIREAVVTAQQGATGDQRLVAYLVPSTQDDSRSEEWNKEIRTYLSSSLPEYMVPSAVVLLEALPLSPNGKVDRRVLPAPDASHFQREKVLVVPRDSLELQLTRIFEQVLQVHPVGVTDNFFALGGHSLLAMRLMAQIHKQFERNLPLSLLIDGGTVEHLAHTLRQQNKSATPSPLVRIQPGGTKRPLFCVHAGAGNVLCYRQLAQHLGSDQPLYGLQALGLYGECEPLTSVEEMARHYSAAIRTVQPQGPYNLLGWCFGGMIAFEIALQLIRQGQEVALLALLDTFTPDSHNLDFLKDEVIVVQAFISEFIHPFAPDEPILSYEELQQLQAEERFAYLVELAKKIQFMSPDAEPMHLRKHFEVYQLNAHSVHGYWPQEIYPQSVTVFQATDHLSSQNGKAWERYTAKPPQVYVVPGTHETLIQEPHVHVLAEKLTQQLHQMEENLSARPHSAV
ncbi:MAG: amino acid adenylation domain-containing protein [Ktedonobacteraceae bacterium]